MTAPTALAAPDVAVRQFKADHDELHAAWQHHGRYCTRCAFGGRCRTAAYLADLADDAGKRWQEAEARLARAAGGGR